ncbi:DUF6768 family protein [Qipengyuania sp. ASV99]|uniref:DUF6768 family protein n=1 Tax=Qipengyuania sp. ASV99 TaxID=3399681 RepID=UPI003A4C7617
MTNTDDRITAALDEDDKAFLASLDSERGLFQQIGDSWQGPMGGWAKLIFGFTFIMGMLFLFVIWQVAHTSNPIVHTLWAISGIALLIVIGFAKQWMFERMNMITILRELKRLQVQVAMLSEKLD